VVKKIAKMDPTDFDVVRELLVDKVDFRRYAITIDHEPFQLHTSNDSNKNNNKRNAKSIIFHGKAESIEEVSNIRKLIMKFKFLQELRVHDFNLFPVDLF
jgi:hypothetical protein